VGSIVDRLGSATSHFVAAPRRYKVDATMAHRVAEAFANAPRASSDPRVDVAYAALAEQARRLSRRLIGGGCRRPVRVVATNTPEPYRDALELADSVRTRRVLELCPVRRDRDRRHPLFDRSANGAFDQFRAVHDIISHGLLGFGFDRDGEFSAWLVEHHLYTGPARWALATELHGQHSVLWTSGERADHKAVLLDPRLLAASWRARR
jgi:hypothetical protein